MRLPPSLALVALRLGAVRAGTEKTEAPTALYLRPGEAVCDAARDCAAAAADLGISTFRAGANFPTKGCYSKNGKAFFSPGSVAEMRTADLMGTQERIYCPAEPSAPTPTPPAPSPAVTSPSFCRAAKECREASAGLGYAPFRAGANFPIKGCYAKNGKAFFSPGAAAEMERTDLPGAQERVYCPAPSAPAPPEPAPSPTRRPTPPPTRQATAPAPAAKEVSCGDEAACRRATSARGIAVFYASPQFGTKGCYAKNGKAFWSPGTAAAMATTDLGGTKERVYCPGG